MFRPFRFFTGYKILRAVAESSADILNLCREYAVSYISFETEGDSVFIALSYPSAKRLMLICRAKDIAIELFEKHGLPAVLWRYRRRWGLVAGAVVGIAFGIVSSFMVWDIRVEGNRRLSESAVLRVLEECGLERGCFYHRLDTDVVENRVLIISDDISWITVNIKGTVAEVEIRETAVRDETEYMSAANLVAVREGVVEYLEDVRGNVAVEAGEAVSRGELLVGGIYGSETEGFRYTVAKGKVYARTEREFAVEIPYTYEKKVYTGNVRVEKYLIFFKKEVKFYRNSRNLYASCDTIDTVEYFHTVDGAELPFGVRTVRYLEYEYRTETRSAEAAAELAYYTLRCEMEKELPEAELLSKAVSFEIGESSYRLNCRLSVIENIAEVKEIVIEDPPIARRES